MLTTLEYKPKSVISNSIISYVTSLKALNVQAFIHLILVFEEKYSTNEPIRQRCHHVFKFKFDEIYETTRQL